MNLPIIRGATEEDWPFIRESWRATFRNSPAVQGANDRAYNEEMTRVFSAIMPTARGRMAVAPDLDLDRLGFVVYSGSLLYFVYVAEALRRMKIVPQLLDGLGITAYAFNTFQGERRLKPSDRGWQFHPRFTLGAS